MRRGFVVRHFQATGTKLAHYNQQSLRLAKLLKQNKRRVIKPFALPSRSDVIVYSAGRLRSRHEKATWRAQSEALDRFFPKIIHRRYKLKL